MIFNMDFTVENFENKIQISVSRATKVGQMIVRESREERTKDGAGNFLFSTHPTIPSLVRADNNYFLIEGSIRLRHDWKEGDNFSDENKDEYRALLDQHAEYHNSTYSDGPGWCEGTTTLGDTPCDWKQSPLMYEPDCYQTTLEILETNTRILCPMQHEAGWSFEKADVAPGATITATKQGTDCFIFFGQACDVNGTAISKNTTKKITSDSINIQNVSSKLCRLVKIYK
tara:strand:- start:1557 stop:2243 length:687 start_codon:yes stop_codon:yes gene_type:complete